MLNFCLVAEKIEKIGKNGVSSFSCFTLCWDLQNEIS
jgi:hypothetical protein